MEFFVFDNFWKFFLFIEIKCIINYFFGFVLIDLFFVVVIGFGNFFYFDLEF